MVWRGRFLCSSLRSKGRHTLRLPVFCRRSTALAASVASGAVRALSPLPRSTRNAQAATSRSFGKSASASESRARFRMPGRRAARAGGAKPPRRRGPAVRRGTDGRALASQPSDRRGRDSDDFPQDAKNVAGRDLTAAAAQSALSIPIADVIPLAQMDYCVPRLRAGLADLLPADAAVLTGDLSSS